MYDDGIVRPSFYSSQLCPYSPLRRRMFNSCLRCMRNCAGHPISNAIPISFSLECQPHERSNNGKEEDRST